MFLGKSGILCRIPATSDLGYVCHHLRPVLSDDYVAVGGKSFRNVHFSFRDSRGSVVNLHGFNLKFALRRAIKQTTKMAEINILSPPEVPGAPELPSELRELEEAPPAPEPPPPADTASMDTPADTATEASQRLKRPRGRPGKDPNACPKPKTKATPAAAPGTSAATSTSRREHGLPRDQASRRLRGRRPGLAPAEGELATRQPTREIRSF